MAKRGRRPTDISMKDGPISEALREAVEASGISKYALARDAGISKPQFYRFLKGERDLSQKGLNSLATRLGVRVVFPVTGGMGDTEPRDSVATSTTETGLELGPDQTAASDRLPTLLDKLGTLLDAEFARFDVHLAGQVQGSRADGPGVLDRLRGWLRVPNRREEGDATGSAGDHPRPDQSDMQSLNKQHQPADVSPPTVQEALDAFRNKVKLLIHGCIEEVMSDFRPSRSDGSETIPSQTPPSPPGTPGNLGTVETDRLGTTGGDEWTTQTIV